MFEVSYYQAGKTDKIKKVFENYKEAKKFFNSLNMVYKFFNSFFKDFQFVGNTGNLEKVKSFKTITSDVIFDINGKRLKEKNLKGLFVHEKDLNAYNLFMLKK